MEVATLAFAPFCDALEVELVRARKRDDLSAIVENVLAHHAIIEARKECHCQTSTWSGLEGIPGAGLLTY